MPFDPDAAGQPGSGIFGLPNGRDESRIILTPVPFDATTSYGGGTSAGPAAILAASMQVDLFDVDFGRVYEAGIFLDEADARVADASARARALTVPIIEKGGADEPDHAAVAEINRAGELVNAITYDRTMGALKDAKIPGLVGGDHSTPFGAIRACAEHHGPIGLLHLDAHMDLRDAFEGFTWSHASIMHNVLTRIPGITRLVQIGIRDFGEGEKTFAAAQDGRVVTHYDQRWAAEMSRGQTFASLVEGALAPLPELVYVSFDIDALDPSLCPGTGTPVPGGLSFPQAAFILHALAQSGRAVVGYDLVEVCPVSGAATEWDAAVGARVLYKLCGAAAAAR